MLFTRHGVDVRYGGDKAFFTPELDFIQMPRLEAFESEEHYWGTKLHELTHWTGHKSRLDRDLAHRFGSQAYAAENSSPRWAPRFSVRSSRSKGAFAIPSTSGTG